MRKNKRKIKDHSISIVTDNRYYWQGLRNTRNRNDPKIQPLPENEKSKKGVIRPALTTPRETRYRDIGGCEISEVNK